MVCLTCILVYFTFLMIMTTYQRPTLNMSLNVQVGKRIVMFSYGSGLTSTMFSFRLQEGQHPFNLSNIVMVMNVSGKLKQRVEVCIFDKNLNPLCENQRLICILVSPKCLKNLLKLTGSYLHMKNQIETMLQLHSWLSVSYKYVSRISIKNKTELSRYKTES